LTKALCLFLILFLAAAYPAFAQDPPRTLAEQLKVIRTDSHPSYAFPPQDQNSSNSANASSGKSHKKRNIIIAVVAAAVVTGVIIAAHNGAYGGSNSNTNGMGY
jgi:hypothetical protein